MPIKPAKPQKPAAPKAAAKSKKFTFQSPKGMHDILPETQHYFDRIDKSLRKVSGFFGFQHIETPYLEDVKLFERGTGASSEVVQKQMFLVKTKGDGTFALRPEMTPGVVRAYLENGLNHTFVPGKFFYFSPLFRYEQPQHGRYRMFHQLGFEILGTDDPAYDAQIINATYKIFTDLKIKNVVIKINSIGCKVCRPGYVKKLKDYYKPLAGKVCKDCAKRLADNPLRMLDCKERSCEGFKAEAPQTIDNLCAGCNTHFKAVLEFLDAVGVPYMIEPALVRGLDYYSKTVFEVFVDGLDFALGGGGRYDYLSETLGGPKLPAVGAACGVERTIEALKAQGVAVPTKQQFKVFLIYMGDQAKKRAVALMEEFYEAGLPIKESFSKDSLKSQLKLADKEQVDYALILGQREVYEDIILLRDMKNGNQEPVALKKIVAEMKKRV